MHETSASESTADPSEFLPLLADPGVLKAAVEDPNFMTLYRQLDKESVVRDFPSESERTTNPEHTQVIVEGLERQVIRWLRDNNIPRKTFRPPSSE